MAADDNDHVLAVSEEQLSPVIVVVTLVLVGLFLLALLYRAGVTVL